MALLPLRNALSFLDSAPAAMQFRETPGDLNADPPVLPNPVWNVANQYFKNDCVFSAVNGGMYIFSGSQPPNFTSIKGGDDPAVDAVTNGNWLSFAPAGLNDVVTKTVTATIAQTALAAAVATVGSFSLTTDETSPDALYLVSWSGVWTNGTANFTGTDQLIWSFNPDGGATAVTLSASCAPGVVASPFNMAGSAVVKTATDTTQIVGSLSVGPTALAQAATLSNLRVTYSRIL
jgi:hypothetical protein